jgi:hypothetical protein
VGLLTIDDAAEGEAISEAQGTLLFFFGEAVSRISPEFETQEDFQSNVLYYLCSLQAGLKPTLTQFSNRSQVRAWQHGSADNKMEQLRKTSLAHCCALGSYHRPSDLQYETLY